MNYFLTWLDNDGTGYFAGVVKKYYVSHRVGAQAVEVTSTDKISQASVFRSEREASDKAYTLNMDVYMGAISVTSLTDKELFEARLKGI